MRYELLLQAATPGAGYPEQVVFACLTGQGATATPDGGLRWQLPSGEVELQPFREGGAVVGTALLVPLTENAARVRDALVAAVAVAAQVQVQVFDPQLNRPVTERDESAVTDQYHRTARYAGEYLGVPEAIGAGFPAATETEGQGPAVKVLLGLGALAVLLYFLQVLLFG